MPDEAVKHPWAEVPRLLGMRAAVKNEKLAVEHHGEDGFQFEVAGVLLTLRTDGPHGVQGSLAYNEGGETMVVSFHQAPPIGFVVHDPMRLDDIPD